MSKEQPVQRIEVAGRHYVLMPLEEYDALAKAAKALSSSFGEPKPVAKFDAGPPTLKDGESSLRGWRRLRGYTLEELAGIVGSRKSSLSQLETGKASGTVELWRKLAKALGASLDEIIPKNS